MLKVRQQLSTIFKWKQRIMQCDIPDSTTGTRLHTCVSIDPFQPMLGTVTCDQILEIIRDWESLRFSSSEEVLHDGVRVVAE